MMIQAAPAQATQNMGPASATYIKRPENYQGDIAVDCY